MGDLPLVAALYVEKGGAYWDDPRIDPWDETRDARNYAGPLPVIAHPPCNTWVSYGRSERRGMDLGCFSAALEAVRRFGGVLEHPARSQAWRIFGLPTPTLGGWTTAMYDPGFTTEVDQHAYGFPTRKLTWLYVVGTPIAILSGPDAGRGCETLWSTQRSKTPAAFREALIALATGGCAAPEELASTRPAAGGGWQT